MKQFVRILVSFLTVCLCAGCSSRKRAMPSGSYTPPSTTAAEAQVLRDNPSIRQLLDEARTWLGTRYAYGGHSRSGTDCSGMVMELFLKVFDIRLPRSSSEQQKYSRPIRREELLPGDLVFFATGRNASQVSHVGLYTGGGRMIHASSSRGVVEDGIASPYFARHYHSSGRIVANAPPAAPQPADATPADRLNDIIEEKIDSIYVLGTD